MDMLDLSFSPSALAAGFLFGVIGLWLFREGRRRDQSRVLWIGVTMMIYPYFLESAKALWGVGLLLCLLAYFFWWG